MTSIAHLGSMRDFRRLGGTPASEIALRKRDGDLFSNVERPADDTNGELVERFKQGPLSATAKRGDRIEAAIGFVIESRDAIFFEDGSRPPTLRESTQQLSMKMNHSPSPHRCPHAAACCNECVTPLLRPNPGTPTSNNCVTPSTTHHSIT